MRRMKLDQLQHEQSSEQSQLSGHGELVFHFDNLNVCTTRGHIFFGTSLVSSPMDFRMQHCHISGIMPTN